MSSEEFEVILKERLEKINLILAVKAKEYRRNDNALHNFEVGAQMRGLSPIRVLDGMLLKHLISYKDMVEDIEKGVYPSEELVNEKLGDIINYFILQEANIKKLIRKDF